MQSLVVNRTNDYQVKVLGVDFSLLLSGALQKGLVSLQPLQ